MFKKQHHIIVDKSIQNVVYNDTVVARISKILKLKSISMYIGEDMGKAAPGQTKTHLIY